MDKHIEKGDFDNYNQYKKKAKKKKKDLKALFKTRSDLRRAITATQGQLAIINRKIRENEKR